MEPMEVFMRAAVLTMFVLGLAVPAAAQTDNVVNPPPPVRSVNLSGPRFGFTSLSQGIVDKLATEHDIVVRTGITQFGWQFEKQFYSKGSGVAAVNEWVLLLGGLDQGVTIPSATWMVGLRTREGTEFGVGPNVTPAGGVLPGVDVGREEGASRVDVVQKRERTAALLAADLDKEFDAAEDAYLLSFVSLTEGRS